MKIENNTQMPTNIAHEVDVPIGSFEPEFSLAQQSLEGGFEKIESAEDDRLEDVRRELQLISVGDKLGSHRISTEGGIDQIDVNLNESSEELDMSDEIGNELHEKEKDSVEIIDQINENVVKLDQSAVTKEDLLKAMLMLYAIAKEDDDEHEKLSLFEILVKVLGTMLISLVDSDYVYNRKKKSANKKSLDIEQLKRKLFSTDLKDASIEKMAA